MPLHRGLLRKRNPPLHRPPAITILHHPIRHHCMTGITADTGAFIAVITIMLSSNSVENQKRGNRAVPPFFNLLCRLGSALIARMFRERLAPQERCVQLWFSSKPGGVMSPPELFELSLLGLLPISLNCKRRMVRSKFDKEKPSAEWPYPIAPSLGKSLLKQPRSTLRKWTSGPQMR